VKFHGVLRDGEPIGDVLVGKALCHQCQDFNLPRAQDLQRRFVIAFSAARGNKEVELVRAKSRMMSFNRAQSQCSAGAFALGEFHGPKPWRAGDPAIFRRPLRYGMAALHAALQNDPVPL
jgi:hypothetical protein